MTPDQRRTICSIRLERADETLLDARLLFESNRWRSALNRVYYSMFYAVNALASAYGFYTSKHSTLEGWFNKNMIHSGLIDEETGKIYRQVFDLRSKGDYDDMVQIDSTTVKKYLDVTEPFIELIRRLILERLDGLDKKVL